MRWVFASAAVAMLAVVVQTTLLPLLLPRGWVPNLLLVEVVWLGLRQGGAGGAVGAFLLGYLLDTVSGTVLGTNAVAFSAVYLLVYFLGRTLWTEGFGPTAVAVVFLAGLVYAPAVVAVMGAVEASPPIWHDTWRYALREASLAALVTPPLFACFGVVQRLLGLG